MKFDDSAAAGSSSSLALSSPSTSPRPSFSMGFGQDQAMPIQFLQIRKGKYMNPIWKPMKCCGSLEHGGNGIAGVKHQKSVDRLQEERRGLRRISRQNI
ncbi:hypothetical protein AMTR_s00053p00191370 [Amborella trichopoda]|uniref:Uncharacterized protein n=1 Tax=Amborella trichopoda TaxID=13333 RepID=W1PB23_AMBTC|nr:hypothetical protein AMTR_s00053p00191370 [Amborella trichopoda]